MNFGMAHVIPDFVYKAMIKQTPFEVFGDGKPGSYVHARTRCGDALVRIILDCGLQQEDFNICGNGTETVVGSGGENLAPT